MTNTTDRRGEREQQLEDRPHLDEGEPTPLGGRSGGALPRDIGTRDEAKRAFERPAGKTRVRKSDETKIGWSR